MLDIYLNYAKLLGRQWQLSHAPVVVDQSLFFKEPMSREAVPAHSSIRFVFHAIPAIRI